MKAFAPVRRTVLATVSTATAIVHGKIAGITTRPVMTRLWDPLARTAMPSATHICVAMIRAFTARKGSLWSPGIV